MSTSQTPSRTPHGASRRTLALVAAAAAAVLVVAIVLISNGGGGGGPSTTPVAPLKPTPRGGPVPKPGDLYVDASSRGGRCDDSRGAAAARSRRTPWCTAQRAVDAAPAGAAVFLRGGSYPAVKVAERADRKRPVTIAGYPGEQATLKRIDTDRGNNVRFERLRVPGGIAIQESAGITIARSELAPAGIYIRHSADVLIEGNDIHHAPPGKRAVLAQGKASGKGDPGNRNLVIRDNHFHDLTYDAIAVYTGVQNLRIEGNEIDHVFPLKDSGLHTDAIQTQGGTGMLFRGNFIHDVTHGMIIKDAPAQDVAIENNLIVHVTGNGINLWNAPRSLVAGNTIWDTGVGMLVNNLDALPGRTSVTVVDNILDNLQSSPPGLIAHEDYNLIGRGRRLGHHTSAQRPKFVDPRHYDYRLAEGSPGIGAGTPRGAPRVDRTGRLRGPKVDIGAYERP